MLDIEAALCFYTFDDMVVPETRLDYNTYQNCDDIIYSINPEGGRTPHNLPTFLIRLTTIATKHTYRFRRQFNPLMPKRYFSASI